MPSGMTQRRHGVAIISEAIIVLGVLAISMIFILLSTQIIGFQANTAISDIGNRMVEDISDHIETTRGYKGTSEVVYRPQIDQYRLTVKQNSFLQIVMPGQNVTSTQFEGLNITETTIVNADSICIRQHDQHVELEAGNCTNIDLSDFCADGRCTDGLCQPEYGEDCTVMDCACPGDASDDAANSTCMPDYDAEGYIGGPSGADDTVELGCVTDARTWKQAKGEQCDVDFECKQTDENGEPMRCSPATSDSGLSGNYCCPEGFNYAGPDEGCVYVNKLHLVFVPLQYQDGEASQFQDWVENEYLNMWLDDLPVSRSDIRVDILDPSQVDNSEIGSSSNGDCPASDINLAIAEANEHVSANYDHAVGIYKETSQCGLAYCSMSSPMYESQNLATGSVSSSANPSIGWGAGVAAQEIAHNWGFNHIPPYECNTAPSACGGQRKYGCPNSYDSDYMQNSLGPLNDYWSQEEDCIKELFKAMGWAALSGFSASDSSCDIHAIS